MTSPIYLQRGTDILTIVNIESPKKIIASKTGEVAVEMFKNSPQQFPNYPVDGVGANLVFQTESGIYVLGGIRSNEYLSRDITKLSIDFPPQISSTIGGKLMDSEKTLLDATIDAIAFKMFYDRKNPQGPLVDLFTRLEDEKGWDSRVCVQTDKWDTGTMCYITSVKWIRCQDKEMQKLNEALTHIMTGKKEGGVPARNITDFRFQVLFPIVINSVESHFKSEVEKALHAYYKDPNAISVTYNDLSVTALAKGGVFDGVGANFICLAFIIADAVKGAFKVAEEAGKLVKTAKVNF